MQISANHLKIGYDDKIVVPDFDVVIHKHDITTFIGPNGCGKSTILKALTRILKCGGVIEIDGNSIHTMPTKEVAKKIAILSAANHAAGHYRRRIGWLWKNAISKISSKII